MTSTGPKHLLEVKHMLTKPPVPQPQLANLWGPPFALTATEWNSQLCNKSKIILKEKRIIPEFIRWKVPS